MVRGWLYYLMIPLMTFAALFQSTAANRLTIRNVKPDLVLILALIGCLVYGPRVALLWAFAGGIVLDIFSGGPMGASSLALMAAVLVTGVGYRTLSRYHLLVPVAVTIVGTIVYGVTYLGVLIVLDALSGVALLDLPSRDIPFWPTVQLVIGPALLYNTMLMLLTVPFLNRLPETQEAESTFS